jgi:hypothetical protein
LLGADIVAGLSTLLFDEHVSSPVALLQIAPQLTVDTSIDVGRNRTPAPAAETLRRLRLASQLGRHAPASGPAHFMLVAGATDELHSNAVRISHWLLLRLLVN